MKQRAGARIRGSVRRSFDSVRRLGRVWRVGCFWSFGRGAELGQRDGMVGVAPAGRSIAVPRRWNNGMARVCDSATQQETFESQESYIYIVYIH